jgi:ABC-type uncharacterized transport system substrate-binding protein
MSKSKAQQLPVVSSTPIVICTQSNHSYHQEATEHFIAALKQKLGEDVEYEVIEVSNKSVEVFAMSMYDHRIVSAHIVVAVGLILTRYLLDLLRHANPQPHLISIGADLSDDEAEMNSGWATLITSIQESVLSRRGELLLFLNPSVKRVGIPFYTRVTSVYVRMQMNALRLFFTSQGVEPLFIPVDNLDALEDAVSEYIRTIDTLLVIEADGCSHEYERLIELCNTHAVTFFAATLKAARSGAAIAYGVDHSLPCREAAQCIEDIVKGSKKHKARVIEIADSRRIVIDVEAAAKQGLVLSKTMLFFLEQGFVFTDIRSVGPLVRDTFI